MVEDGTLRSTPTVSDESVLTATARAGLQADSFAATIEVTPLARAQTAYSDRLADRAPAIRQGTMKLPVGATVSHITLEPTTNRRTPGEQRWGYDGKTSVAA